MCKKIYGWFFKQVTDPLLRRELIAYAIVGILSTLSSAFWYWFFLMPVGLHYLLANALGWFVDVWFDFVLNKYFVFLSREKGKFWHEAWKFISARLFSAGLDMLLLWLLVELLKLGEMYAKVIVIAVIIVVNYLLAKVLIFRKRKTSNEDS